MYFHEMNAMNSLLLQVNHRQRSRTLVERAQAFLDAKRGTPESRDIILGLLLANAQLKDAAQLAEDIIKANESGVNWE